MTVVVVWRESSGSVPCSVEHKVDIDWGGEKGKQMSAVIIS